MINLILDIQDNEFLLKVNLNEVAQKDRFKSNFISYGGYIELDGILKMPFNNNFSGVDLPNIDVQFSKIQKLCKKYECQIQQSQKASESLDEINRENNAFLLFSNKALAIRNNHHNLDDFEQFIHVISKAFPLRVPYPLQLLCAYHLAFSQNACNFSVPGAGKTTTVYAAYAYLKSLSENDIKHVDRLLIISPLAAFHPWKNEFSECFGINPSYKELVGLNFQDRKSFFCSIKKTELTLISYQSATSTADDIKNIINYLKRYKVMVVLDEAHKIKNTDGGKTAEGILQIAKFARARVVLTGTPAPNGFQDLYNLFKFIWPQKNIISSSPSYLKEISDSYTPSSKLKTKELINCISPYFMRVRKSDLCLPEAILHPPIFVEMDEAQRFIYDKIESKYIAYFDSNDDGQDSFLGTLKKAKMIRLMQCVTNPSLLNKPLESSAESGVILDDSVVIKQMQDYKLLNIIPNKFIRLKELIHEIIQNSGADGKVVVWTNFVGNMEHLQQYLNGEGILAELLYGATPNENENTPDDIFTREKIINRFHDDDCPFKVIIANPFAVGESISLHKACRHAVYLEKNFNAAMYMQSKDRVHRYGLKEGEVVHYYHILSTNSIDEIIHERVLLKEERMLHLIESEEIPLLNLNMDEGDESIGVDDFRAIINDYYARKYA